MNTTCALCQKTFESPSSLSRHIFKTHGISSEEYYKKFVGKDTEGLCKVCGKPTKFKGLEKGYSLYCSAACVSHDQELRNIWRNKMKLETGYDHPLRNPEIKAAASERSLKATGYKYHTENPEFQDKNIRIIT